MLVTGQCPLSPELRRFELVRSRGRGYAANCIRVNDHILVAAGYPRLADALTKLGYDLVALDVSEYRKMDGGLSCLSLRFRGQIGVELLCARVSEFCPDRQGRQPRRPVN